MSEEKAFKSNSKWTFKFIRRLCPVGAVLASPDFKFPPADLVDFHSPTNLKMVSKMQVKSIFYPPHHLLKLNFENNFPRTGL